MMDPAANVIDDRFEIQGRLGSGGMSLVYRARDRERNEDVAIKILSPEFLERQPEERERKIRRFQREARILEQLRGIDQVVEFVSSRLDGDMPYIAMELVEGHSLREVLDRAAGRLDTTVFLAITEQVLIGLKAIHAERVLHRDLAPENIVIVRRARGRPRVKFLDFGIGKSLEPEVHPVTRKPTMMGKPQYLSPEQTRGESLSSSSDIYSLGVILYEMVTYHLPIPLTSFAEVARVRNEPPIPIIRYRESERIPEELRALIMACLAKKPGDRPTVDELLECTRELTRRVATGQNISAAFSEIELATQGEDPRRRPGMLEPGASIGPFELQSLNRSGPHGESWEGLDTRDKSEVVIEVTHGNPEALEAARARAAAQIGIDDPRLRSVLDARIIEGCLCVVRLPGLGDCLAETLAEHGPLAPEVFLQVSEGLVQALESAHERTPPLIHGHLDPRNVSVDAFGAVQLRGFGLGPDTREIDPFDSPGRDFACCAPEVSLGEDADRLSDIYSLGCVLYAMAAGRPPFDGSESAMAWKQVNAAPDPTHLVGLEKSLRGVSALILGCLAKDPEQRPESVREVARRLDLMSIHESDVLPIDSPARKSFFGRRRKPSNPAPET